MQNVEATESPSGLEIAIVGMAGRFPGARNVDELWQNLVNGVESITFFSDEELIASGVEPALLEEPGYVKAGAVLESVEQFDAALFDYSPREAEITDPQHRLFLECAWEALENAGYNPERYEGAIGVYAGASLSQYLLNNLATNPRLAETVDPWQVSVGCENDFLATRVSYKLNLKGPAITVQTACSTSLVAVCQACQSLLNYECDVALAGGVSVNVPQKAGYLYQPEGILSPDGHCRAFDAQARGMILGSGVAIVVLKRLENALTDGDRIHAVVKGSALNNDGALRGGFTAPGVAGQAEVITEALANAGVEAESITYVETHGTGTALGDPIEIAALTKAFRTSTQKKGFCAIGSVKTNVGHLNRAAGVTGLIKAVLMLTHKQMPPSLNFEQPNPEIDFANSPFYVNAEMRAWSRGETPLRAGVSSFGFGGTNAHVILQEAPPVAPSGHSRPWQLLVLMARTSAALETATVNLASHLKRQPHLDLADVAHTLLVGRQVFGPRRMVTCRDLDDAIKALETCDPQRVFTAVSEIQNRPVAFMFPGQGAQYANMALELYQTEPVFRQHVDVCAGLLRPHLKLDLRALLYPDASSVEEANRQLSQTAITQPVLFVIEYALAQLLMSWGIQPQAMIGHSIGEYVAACLAGVFCLEDALALVADRGRLMQSLPAGSMLAVPLSEEEVQALLEPGLSLAAVNAPAMSVVSGPGAAIEALHDRLTAQGITCSRLRTSHAFHSAMMEPILESFTEHAGRLQLNPPQMPYISNVTGSWVKATEATRPDYWAKQLRQTVRFGAGIHELMQDSTQVLLEVGPGNTLSKLARLHPNAAQSQPVLATIRHPHEQRSDVEFLLTTLGRLWLVGANVDWAGFYARERRHRLPLPTYPFERQRYWVEPQGRGHAAGTSAVSLAKKARMADWFYTPVWKTSPLPKDQDLTGEGSWLLFMDERGLGAALAALLRRAGQDVISATVGEQFSRVEESVYTLNPRQRGDYAALFEALRGLDKLPRRIVHLWSVTSRRQAQSDAAFFNLAQDNGFYSLMFLAQALGKHTLTDVVQLWVVSNNVQKVESTDVVHPEKATILGPCKIIPQEYPHVACRHLDVVLPEPGVQPESALAHQLLAEIGADSSESVVAYRGRRCWLQTFELTPLRDEAEPIRPLRPNGVYLITGGFSGVGLGLAKYLAETVQARLILVEKAASNAGDGAEVERALKQAGAQVLVVNADVADEAQMQTALAAATERFGQIHGAIHAAGAVSEKIFRPIQEADFATCQRHFESKVLGLSVLEKVLRDRSLDFCLLNSSLSTVLGGVGYVTLAAADLALDAFAHHQNANGHFSWISVNWDAWQLEEKVAQIAAIVTDLGRLALTPAEGQDACRRILAAATTDQVVVSTGDLALRIEKERQKIQALRGQAQSPQQSLYERPNVQSTYVPPRDDLERQVAEIWQQILGIKKIGIHDNFFELGGHSLLATKIILHVRQAFQVELSVRKLFTVPTVAGMAEYIETVRWAVQGLQTTPGNQENKREEGEL